jgi:hypothetical protein
MMDFSGSRPTAIYRAAISRTFARNTFGSWGTVSACRSTMQKRQSWSSCIETQFFRAPRYVPRWDLPLGCMPLNTLCISCIARF